MEARSPTAAGRSRWSSASVAATTASPSSSRRTSRGPSRPRVSRSPLAPHAVLLDWRLREVDYGALTGAHPDTLERERYVETPFPGGESYRDAVRRVGHVLDELAAAHPGERILLIGHTATRWALDHLLEGRELGEAISASFDWREGWEYVLGDRAASGAAA